MTALDRLLFDQMEDGPALVIAPKRVAIDTWSKETVKWEHLGALRVELLTGSLKERQAALKRPADLYVINRELVCWLVDYVGASWPFKIVILDELSSFKSAQAKRFKALRRVRGRIKRIIGLTGTPRPNGLEDLWAQVYLLDQGQRLGRTLTAFRERFLVPEKMNGHIVYSYKPRDGAEETVYELLSDICMSVKKDDVLSLPGQIYEDVELDLPPGVLKSYKQFEKEQVLAWWRMMEVQKAAGVFDYEISKSWEQLDELSKSLGVKVVIHDDVAALSAAALTNKLLQYANGTIYDVQGKAHALHNVKLDALEELIEAAGGDPVLVLYNYKHDAERIRERIPCRALNTAEDISAWNRGEIPVALAHPASVGHGLNMQFGGHITIWYGLPWSLELYQQANERLNRPGQKHVCRVYHLMAKGTHDARVLQSLKNKDKGQEAAIEALRLEIAKEAKR